MAEGHQNGHTGGGTTASVTRKAALGTATTVLFRLLSFAGTQWCNRRLDPETLGRTSVRLELLLSSILWISREGFRLTLTKRMSSQGSAWLTVPISTVLSITALLWHFGTEEARQDADYRFAGILYCVAAAIEGWAEPAVLHFLRDMSIAEKASAEGIAVLAKTAATVAALKYLADDSPVTAFGMAQVVYATTYFCVLYGTLFRKRVLPPFTNVLDAATLRLTCIFTAQGLLKFGLQEGDKIVMISMAASYDQGVYAMGSNYGGLAARMVLQPLEESSRLLFSRLSGSNNNRENKDNNTKASSHLEMAYTVLVKTVLYFGLIFCCLAVNYTQVLLSVLAGQKWGDNEEAVRVLSAFCVYTAFLAWNGMTEAFCYGVASSASEIGRLSVAHTVTGVFFGVAAPLCVSRYGTVGLVAANCVAMLGRALFSVHFTARYFAQEHKKTTTFVFARLLGQMFPSALVTASFVGAYFSTQWSMQRMIAKVAETNVGLGSGAWLRLALEHVGIGVACAIAILSLAYVLERDLRRSIRTLWHVKSD